MKILNILIISIISNEIAMREKAMADHVHTTHHPVCLYTSFDEEIILSSGGII